MCIRDRALHDTVVYVQSFLFLEVVIVADKQHTVSGRNAEQGDKPDNCRNADLARRDDQCENTAEQCKRQVQQDNAGFLHAAELVVKQQEDDNNADE